jgi:anti-sigma B factor antagonist
VTEIQQTGTGLRLTGFLDVRGVADVRSAIEALLDSTDTDVHLDLSNVVAIDATGLALIVSAHRRAVNQGRQLVLEGVGPSLARLLAVTRLHRVLTVHRDSTSAVPRRRPAA